MELHQRSLIKISLLGFLITFTLLYLIDNNFELKTTNIQNITNKDINKHIKINGTITRASTNNNNVFLEITNKQSTIKGVLFQSNTTPKKNKNYSIEGKISLYNQKLEIIIHKIKPIK